MNGDDSHRDDPQDSQDTPKDKYVTMNDLAVPFEIDPRGPGRMLKRLGYRTEGGKPTEKAIDEGLATFRRTPKGLRWFWKYRATCAVLEAAGCKRHVYFDDNYEWASFVRHVNLVEREQRRASKEEDQDTQEDRWVGEDYFFGPFLPHTRADVRRRLAHLGYRTKDGLPTQKAFEEGLASVHYERSKRYWLWNYRKTCTILEATGWERSPYYDEKFEWVALIGSESVAVSENESKKPEILEEDDRMCVADLPVADLPAKDASPAAEDPHPQQPSPCPDSTQPTPEDPEGGVKVL